MLLHPLAPLVECLVGRFVIGVVERATGAAIGALEACDKVVKGESPALEAGEERLRLFEGLYGLAPTIRGRAGGGRTRAVCK